MDVLTKKVKKLVGRMGSEPFTALLNIIYFRSTIWGF
jgi:hypothetical protein